MIIIYPDKSTFLGIPLFDEKIEKKTKEEKKDKAQSFKDEVDKSFQEVMIEMINNLSNEIKEIILPDDNPIRIALLQNKD